MVLQPEHASGVAQAGASAANGGAGGTSHVSDAGAAGRGSAGMAAAGRGGSHGDAGPSAGSTAGRADAAAEAGGAGSKPPSDASLESSDASEQSGAGSGASPADAGEQVADGGPQQPATAADSDCDFSGIWMVKQVTVSEALGLPQSSNNWYYLELEQSGTEIRVSRHFDCGIQVVGSATVTFSRPTLQALLTANAQVGRKGSLVKEGDRCTFDFDRFWSIRGAEERFLPNGMRDTIADIDDVAAQNPLPTRTKTEGAIDVEGDGKLGVAVQVAGVISGVRNSVQRDWTHWFTEPGYEIMPSTDWPDELRIRSDFDNEESILDPSEGLLTQGSQPSASAKHIVRLRFLGRDTSDPRAAAIVKADDVETCFAIQDALQAETLE